jgi:hypothetical protein
MEYLGLHNKPKAVVHPEHLPTGPLEEEEGGGGGGGGGRREEEEEEEEEEKKKKKKRRRRSAQELFMIPKFVPFIHLYW